MGLEGNVRRTILDFCQTHDLNSIDAINLYTEIMGDVYHTEFKISDSEKHHFELNLGIPHNPWSGKRRSQRKTKK